MDSKSIDELILKDFKIENVSEFRDLPKSEQNHEGKRSEIFMSYKNDMPSVCPKCGGRLYSHTGSEIVVADTVFVGAPCKLRLSLPRRRCPDCGTVIQPQIEGIEESRYMTKRLYAKLANLSLKRSFNDIAAEYGLTNNTVKNVFKEFIAEKKEELRFKTPAFLGLDEIKIKKLGELTVVTDLEHKTLYDMMQGRNQISLTDYFSTIPNPENVLWVCTDMYRPFEKTIKTALPNAQWVIDHYHVVAYANRAMDRVRIKVQSEMSKGKRIATKKGLAYTMRTRAYNLSPEEAAKIKECRMDSVLRPLATAFDLKEDFFSIYDDNPYSADNAKETFRKWEESIPSDDIYEDFRGLASTVHNFYEQIFNYWECPSYITNGFTECTNRIIRENNVKGRGNSFEILRGRTLYRYANLEKIEQNGMLLGPMIPKSGPLFHYEEVKGIQEVTADDESAYYNSKDYDPMIGLIPGINFDPETGEIFDDTLLDD